MKRVYQAVAKPGRGTPVASSFQQQLEWLKRDLLNQAKEKGDTLAAGSVRFMLKDAPAFIRLTAVGEIEVPDTEPLTELVFQSEGDRVWLGDRLGIREAVDPG